jgi:two-component system invasion response regulator UvrY
MPTAAIRIMIVDDHTFIRMLLRTMVLTEVGLEVVGEAASGQEALDMLPVVKPDLILMDIHMPGLSGLETVDGLLARQPNLKILVVTSCRDSTLMTQFMRAGCRGFFSKVDGRAEMLKAIRTVCSERIYTSRSLGRGMPPTKKSLRNPFDVLTERELQVAFLLVQGASMRDIAQKLSAAPRTIQTHRLRIFIKLDVGNDVELTLMAYRHRLIKVGEQHAVPVQLEHIVPINNAK